MRKLILVAIALGAGWLIYHKANERPYEPPPGFIAAMEHFAKEVQTDWNGPKGEEARTVCKRITGVNAQVNNAIDVINAGYNEATAEKFADCMVNYMYPIDAKKRP